MPWIPKGPRPPPVRHLSTCPKLKKGQLLMHRHQVVFERGNGTYGGRYQHIADESKRRSIILAKRMRDHADKCKRCSQGDENFYGLEWW